MKNSLYIIFIVLCHLQAYAQISRPDGFSLDAKRGFLFPHKYEMAHLPKELNAAIELGALWRVDGQKDWHELYNRPNLGLRFTYFSTGNEELIGNAYGLSFSVHFPLSKGRLYPSFTPQVGLGYVDKIYDVDNNPKNNALGTRLNINVSFEFGLNYKFQKNVWGLGVEFKHFSNGASKLPNLGLNWPFLNLNYQHYFTDELPLNVDTLDYIIPLPKNWKHLGLAVFSVKDVYPLYEGLSPVYGLSYVANRRLSVRSSFDLGLDLIMNTALNRDVSEKPNFFEALQVGTYLGYVQDIGKLDLFVGMGAYVKNAVNANNDLYHRLGARYALNEKLYAHFSIKSNWGRADYFEYGILYKLF